MDLQQASFKDDTASLQQQITLFERTVTKHNQKFDSYKLKEKEHESKVDELLCCIH